ncbi:MAG: tetratricopeptide repeat protein [Ignavibacteria bacterium]|nr:tetratricopeptide repeat protein [Ignavibacteria bacterium]
MNEYQITDFQTDVIDRSFQMPVVVDFWAEWCGPCRVLGPVLESLAGTSDGLWVLAKVDTERHPDIAAEYGIRGIPNVKLFIDGKVANEFTGALPEQMVKQWLETSLPNPVEKEVMEARHLLDSGNQDRALEILASVLKRDPHNEGARVAMARTELFREPSKVPALLEGIEEDSESFSEASAIRIMIGMREKAVNPGSLPEGGSKSLYVEGLRLAAEGKHDAAIERFIDVIRNDRGYDDDGARKACVALFAILGEEHPVTQKHRRTFARALNV